MRGFFDGVLTPEAYERRPIALRNPFVFYDGHLAAFPVNTFLKHTLGRPGIDAELERLFERGIDPESAREVKGSPWPPRLSSRPVRNADRAVEEAPPTPTGRRKGPSGISSRSSARVDASRQLHYMLHQLPAR
jgi:hypothetical protein